MSPSVLNERLKELRDGLLLAQAEGGYTLTPTGLDLERRLKPLDRWAEDWASQLPQGG